VLAIAPSKFIYRTTYSKLLVRVCGGRDARNSHEGTEGYGSSVTFWRRIELLAALTIHLIIRRIAGQLTFGCTKTVLALDMVRSAASGTRALRLVYAVRRQGGLGGDLRANLSWTYRQPKGSSSSSKESCDWVPYSGMTSVFGGETNLSPLRLRSGPVPSGNPEARGDTAILGPWPPELISLQGAFVRGKRRQ